MIIRTLRENHGWSQEQLADISGISVRTIQRIEQGGRGSLETLKCLAAVFETTIPELKEHVMPIENNPDPDRPVESREPKRQEPRDTDRLSDGDRAALRYVRNLQRYDDWDGDWDGDGEAPMDPALSPQERRITREVRRLRGFYHHLFSYLVVIGGLLVINLLTSPGYLWFLWAGGGWGIGLLLHGLDTFSSTRMLGHDWERKQVEKRLRKMAGQ